MTESLYEFVENVMVPGPDTISINEKRAKFVRDAYKSMREMCEGTHIDIPDIITFANARGNYSYAAFAWKKGTLVRSVQSCGGRYGIVEKVEPRSGVWDFEVLVRHSDTREYYDHNAIENADMPEEILELAMSELSRK